MRSRLFRDVMNWNFSECLPWPKSNPQLWQCWLMKVMRMARTITSLSRFDTSFVKARWERWCRWNCDLRIINARKKGIFCRTDAQITWPYAYYVTLGSRCKMANSSSEDDPDTLRERPTRIQPYQFEPVRQDFERVPEHRVSFKANPMQYSTDVTSGKVTWLMENPRL